MNRNIEIDEIKTFKCHLRINNTLDDMNKVYKLIRRIINTEFVINGERSTINLRHIKKYYLDDNGVGIVIERYKKIHRYHYCSRKR